MRHLLTVSKELKQSTVNLSIELTTQLFIINKLVITLLLGYYFFLNKGKLFSL